MNTDEFLLVEILPLVRTSPKLGLGHFIAALHSLAKKGITLKLCQRLCGGELKWTRGEHTSVQFNQRLTCVSGEAH